MNNYADYIDINPEVLGALQFDRPIVALESTIISHGMPYPKNLEVAMELENTVRKNGAAPATIAIIDGRIKLGLTKSELEYIASSKDIIKVSRRDIPYIIATKKSGATTVCSTMIFAQIAGIKIMATGGIGGVHKEASKTFDISADLTELSKTNVAVVCSGVKSILDIGLTLEKLETFGVPVIGYCTDSFPSFYTRNSGYKVDNTINSPEECAKLMKAKWDLDLDGGIIFANPIPQEFEADENEINKAISLVLNNASVASKIAVCYNKTS